MLNGSNEVNDVDADEDWYGNEMGFLVLDVVNHLSEHSSDGFGGMTSDSGEKTSSEEKTSNE